MPRRHSSSSSATFVEHNDVPSAGLQSFAGGQARHTGANDDTGRTIPHAAHEPVQRELPASAARSAFERSNNVRCNPATIEIAFLGLNALAIDEARLHTPGVKREVIA